LVLYATTVVIKMQTLSRNSPYYTSRLSKKTHSST